MLKGEKMAESSYEDWVKMEHQCDKSMTPTDLWRDNKPLCIPPSAYLDYMPNALTQEIPTYTWETPHSKCEPTLGITYSQIVDLQQLFGNSNNLHVHVVFKRYELCNPITVDRRKENSAHLLFLFFLKDPNQCIMIVTMQNSNPNVNHNREMTKNH